MTVLTLPCTDEFALGEALDAMGGDGELLQEVVEIFLETGLGRIGSLEQAVADGQLDHVQTVAHGMKGSAASIGALGFSAAARELESVAKAGDWDRTARLLDRLQEKFEDFRAACSDIDWESLPRLEY